jgi:hypothetical protein
VPSNGFAAPLPLALPVFALKLFSVWPRKVRTAEGAGDAVGRVTGGAGLSPSVAFFMKASTSLRYC